MSAGAGILGAMKAILRRVLPAPARRAIRRGLDGTRDAVRRSRWRKRTGKSGPVGIARFGGFDIAYRTGSVDLDVIHHSFDADIFLPAIPGYTLPPDAVVIDVGAHIGTFTLLAARKAPRGRVFAIEASRETFEILSENIAMNGAANVTAHHLALAGASGVVTLHHDPEGNYGHTITKALSSSGETVAATTLARYLDDYGIGRVDLVKFNCEGAEFPILLATPANALRRIGRMIVLYHGDLVGEDDAAKILAHLDACGFDTRVEQQRGDRGWIIATRRT